ncbi:MAG: hypothetical protein KAX39_07050 [candidate division Zixibacteria bacterium]|nr:hypothetical protein [candidate division Zixibacteria bacterium]
MLMLDLRVNDCDLALGHRVDFERLKAADFRKAGILGKLTAIIKKKDLVYRTGNCHIACFDETFDMCNLEALPSDGEMNNFAQMGQGFNPCPITKPHPLNPSLHICGEGD